MLALTITKRGNAKIIILKLKPLLKLLKIIQSKFFIINMKNLLKHRKFFTLSILNDMSHDPPPFRCSTSSSFSSKLTLFLHYGYIQNRKGKLKININHNHYHFLLMGFIYSIQGYTATTKYGVKKEKEEK